jgi:uncharacterized protein (TIGR03086 family)
MIDLTPACRELSALVTGLTDDELENPTPCTEYSVSQIVAHLDGGARVFTAMAAKKADEQPELVIGAAGWRGTFADCIEALGAAWNDPGAWQGSSAGAGVELPNETWGKIALTEVVVHAWDLAKATGRSVELPEETVQACFDHVAGFLEAPPVPELWGPPLEAGPDAPLLDQVVAITGRKPQ